MNIYLLPILILALLGASVHALWDPSRKVSARWDPITKVAHGRENWPAGWTAREIAYKKKQTKEIRKKRKGLKPLVVRLWEARLKKKGRRWS